MKERVAGTTVRIYPTSSDGLWFRIQTPPGESPLVDAPTAGESSPGQLYNLLTASELWLCQTSATYAWEPASMAIENCDGQRSAAQPISQQPGPAIRVRRRPVLNADDRVVQLLRRARRSCRH